ETMFGELQNRLGSERKSSSLAEQLISLDPGFADPVFNGPITLASIISFIDGCLQQSVDPSMKFPSLL
ncbi:MAG TPA: hypothetical protein VE690_10155, partial [Rhodopila sp.]|nr:hypothetical protein [Rhodopila sp.]